VDDAARLSRQGQREICRLAGITTRELFTLAPLAIIVVVLGVYPSLAIDLISPRWELLKGL
jgi:NADH:ubiquinone oxidoreductase subunit 4 (subunit M)